MTESTGKVASSVLDIPKLPLALFLSLVFPVFLISPGLHQCPREVTEKYKPQGRHAAGNKTHVLLSRMLWPCFQSAREDRKASYLSRCLSVEWADAQTAQEAEAGRLLVLEQA